jgi:ADP-heptose:LPS heptosyltransferase
VTRALVVRADGMGDVLLAGPAVRAIATGADVTMLCAPPGADAARRLPGVERVLEHRLPWIDADPAPVDDALVSGLVADIAEVDADEAVILTSFHQSPLPTALLARMAGIRRIGAISVDYPGSLVDVRHAVDEDVHEVQRGLSLARAMGYDLPPGDDGLLRLRHASRGAPRGEHVVVHPGASVPARTLAPQQWRAVIGALGASGRRVVVTGTNEEIALVTRGHTPLDVQLVDGTFDALAETLGSAAATVVGNTGPAHLAAATGTPVVSCYAPTVPAARWRPWGVPFVLLGDQTVDCAGCRARVCPHTRQRCLACIEPADVVAAVDVLVGTPSHESRSRVSA